MFTKEQFLNSLQHETNVIKHLYTKIPDNSLDFRPTPGQRSLLELLQYLCKAGIAPTKGVLARDWAQARAERETMVQIQADRFLETMDRQMNDIRNLLKDYNDEDLLQQKTISPLGKELFVGEALVNTSLKFLAAYKIQLFLYLKLLGRVELSSMNCWMGMDPPA